MRFALIGLAIVLAAGSFSIRAQALTDPNGDAIPSAMGCSGGKPTGLLPVFACACTQAGVCNIGAPCPSATSCPNGQNGTCESTMWHSFNDNTCIPSNHSGIDPWADASLAQQTFHPTCALTFTVVSRGTALFQDVFGWYNAVGSQPDPSDLHVMLGCTAGPGTQAVLDLTKEPAWKGGDIGFFLMTPESQSKPGTCANGNCCPTVADVEAGGGRIYYTESAYDPDTVNGKPFIHVLAYGSQIFPKRFYFACEDTYAGTSADFTDLVTSVDGVECSGAGQQCNTGKLGVCAFGVTDCASGTLGCQQIFQPSPDKCNGVDDDCNGMVDDGATCPEPGDVCENGKCVPHCGSVEFPCQGGGSCDSTSGLCVDPKCVGVTCPSGQICTAGTCGTPCDGVVCPHGQSCVGNACVDLCGGVSCASGQVCVDGACVPGCGACGGVTCAAPLSCDMTSGACADTSCGACPNGTYCSSGHCVPACTGAKCPAGQTCQAGNCVGPGATPVDGGFTPVGGPDGGAGAGDDGGANGDNGFVGNARGSGCSCRSAGGTGGEEIPLLAFAALSLALTRRLAAARLRP
jgi:hypothetical protein